MKKEIKLCIAIFGIIVMTGQNSYAQWNWTPPHYILSNATDLVGVGLFSGTGGSPTYKLDVEGDININSGSAYKYNGTDVISLQSSDNILVGLHAAISTSGSSSVFVGNYSGYSNTSGSDNAFLGYSSGYSNTSGTGNSFIGHFSGWSNTNGDGNSFLGSSAGYSNTTGDHNAFVGYYSGLNNSSGLGNSAMGYYAGYTNTTGCYNSYFGYNAHGDVNVFNATAIGYNAYAHYSNTLILGGTGDYEVKVGIGTSEPTEKLTIYGGDVLIDNLHGSGSRAVMADYTGKLIVGSGTTGFWSLNGNGGTLSSNYLGTTDGNDLIFKTYGIEGIRLTAINSSTPGNVGIGTTTPGSKLEVNGDINITSSTNVFRIANVPNLNAGGTNNIFVGADAGNGNHGGRGTFLGYHAGYSGNTGDKNTFLGYYSGNTNTTGSENTLVGNESGKNITEGIKNTFLGSRAGSQVTTGNKNTYIGYNTGDGTSTLGGGGSQLNRATAIGCDTKVTADNNIILGSKFDLSGSSGGGGEGVSIFGTDPTVLIDHVGIGVTETNTDVKFHVDANGFPNTAIFMDGNVGINNSRPAYDLDVNYNIHASGNVNADGDIQATGNVIGNVGSFQRVEAKTDIYMGLTPACSTCTSATYVYKFVPSMSVAGSGAYPICDLGDFTYGLSPSTNKWFNSISYQTLQATSDIRLKREINDLNYGLSDLMNVRPVSYYFKNGICNQMKRIGFIAQELGKVIPEVVSGIETDTTYLTINYIDLIPVLVKSIQEQQGMIDSLKIQLNALATNNSQNLMNPNTIQNSGNNKGSSSKNIANSLGGEFSVLYQNEPNPFKENTSIEYYLTQNIQKASLIIFDMNGTLLKTIPINQPGKGSVQIMGGDLKPGMYFYALIADNKEVDSKKMILLD